MFNTTNGEWIIIAGPPGVDIAMADVLMTIDPPGPCVLISWSSCRLPGKNADNERTWNTEAGNRRASDCKNVCLSCTKNYVTKC